MISKAQAAQRAGRAGRTAPGKCYRLYMLEDYERMNNVPAPAIHRTDFTSTALQLKGIIGKKIHSLFRMTYFPISRSVQPWLL